MTVGHSEVSQDSPVVSSPSPFLVICVPAPTSAAYEDCSSGAVERPVVIEQACSSARSSPLQWRHPLGNQDAWHLHSSADESRTGSRVVDGTEHGEPGGYFQAAAVAYYPESPSDQDPARP